MNEWVLIVLAVGVAFYLGTLVGRRFYLTKSLEEVATLIKDFKLRKQKEYEDEWFR